MSCVSRIPLIVKGERFMVPCGQCMSCRLTYQRQVMFAVDHEVQEAYKHGSGCSFVTLTYSDDKVPLGPTGIPTLYKRHVQLFNKRLRINLDRKSPGFKYKYIISGEYGDKFNRPHYHALFIGLADVQASSYVRKFWDYGLVDTGPLRPGGARYVLKYITKSPRGLKAKELFDDIGIARPFLLRSRRLGYQWINDNLQALSDNDYTYLSRGTPIRIPGYYERLLTNARRVKSPDTVARMEHAAAEANMDVFTYSRLKDLIIEESLIKATRDVGLPADDFVLNSAKHAFSNNAVAKAVADEAVAVGNWDLYDIF